jgi:Sulfotransferase family
MLDAESMISSAQASTRLENFGDESFREPLGVLVDAINREADLTDEALAMSNGELTRSLEIRLRAQRWFDELPEIMSETVSPAFVIVGPQRSGTSKLFRLLAADPRWTKLYTWQAMNPVPPSRSPTDGPDPRIAEAEAVVERMRWLQPAHEMDAHAPEMEAMLMTHGFMTNSPTRLVPSHQRYCEAADHTAVYAWLHSMLQFIQWQNGGERRPWILKSPTHLPTLRELHAQYPETALVMTHRHPLTSVASMFKLVELGTERHARSVDRGKIRDMWLHILTLNMQRFLECRDQVTTAQWIDVPYPELSGQSHDSVRRIYESIGVSVTEETLEVMDDWERANPPHKQGEFVYQLEDYGLTEADVEREFAPYISRFGHLF